MLLFPFFVAHSTKVEVGLLYDLPIAKSVATEPLTPDDWEILVHAFDITSGLVPHFCQELHAEHVESTLLSQVRVAPANQEVDVWVLGRTRIRLRVRTWLHILHPDGAETISVSFEPSSARAVLLANDTELSVAPKTRRLQNSENTNSVNTETPVVKSDPTPKFPSAGRPSHSVLLRVLPTSIFPHHLSSPSNFTSVIYVSELMLSVARLEGLLPSDPNTSLIGNVKRLAPPTDPAGATNQAPSDAPAVAKVLNPSEATKRENVKGEQSKDGYAKVIGLDGVPEGQMIVAGGMDGVEDWDVVQ